jgi:hypothetical protein
LTLLAPAVQYGDWAIVSKRMRRIVTRISRGEGVVAVLSEDGLLDVDEHAGRMIVGGRVLAGGTDFHCFMPWRTLWQKLLEDPGTMDAVFRESLSAPWGVLGLLTMDNTPWFYGNEERYEPFLDAALKVWDELDAVGPRYYIAFQGESLWSIPNSLHYILANMGVPHDLLRAPLPPEGLRALLRYARIAS